MSYAIGGTVPRATGQTMGESSVAVVARAEATISNPPPPPEEFLFLAEARCRVADTEHPSRERLAFGGANVGRLSASSDAELNLGIRPLAVWQRRASPQRFWMRGHLAHPVAAIGFQPCAEFFVTRALMWQVAALSFFDRIEGKLVLSDNENRAVREDVRVVLFPGQRGAVFGDGVLVELDVGLHDFRLSRYRVPPGRLSLLDEINMRATRFNVNTLFRLFLCGETPPTPSDSRATGERLVGSFSAVSFPCAVPPIARRSWSDGLARRLGSGSNGPDS